MGCPRFEMADGVVVHFEMTSKPGLLARDELTTVGMCGGDALSNKSQYGDTCNSKCITILEKR
jgi:hypothetical protein